MNLVDFSEHYGLSKSQIELDFVNILVNENMDLPLFIDPRAISIRSDQLGKDMYNTIQSYFQLILNHIRNGENDQAKSLLSKTHEFKEIKLGTSKGGSGKGMGGGNHSENLFNELVKSKAGTTGVLKHIEDAALVIEGISYDRISDMIGHILKYHLIQYTKQQCDLHGIQTRPRSGLDIWDGSDWIDLETAELPFIEEDTGRIILVPKSIVRKGSFSLNFPKFYNKYILEFEQARHLAAGSGLCRVLKGGEKIKPTKKVLKKEIAESKKTALSYLELEPQLLDQYKSSLKQERRDENLLKLFDPMEEENEEVIVGAMINKLFGLKPGVDNDAFHNLIVGCLLYVFYPHLENPKKEFQINEGRKSIDISMINSAKGGFFESLSKRGIPCHRIYFECKNYSGDLKNPEYDQLLSRFSKFTSSIGFMVCRSIEDNQKMIDSTKYPADKQEKFIYVLTDEIIIQFMKWKLDRKEYKINKYLQEKFTNLIEK